MNKRHLRPVAVSNGDHQRYGWFIQWLGPEMSTGLVEDEDGGTNAWSRWMITFLDTETVPDELKKAYERKGEK